MPQHDVYRTSDGDYLLDCQSDLLDEFNTRFVVPLLDPEHAPKIARRLNPIFEVSGKTMVMYTQFASSVPEDVLKEYVASLEQHHFEILTALDAMIGSY
jgi:toxin CcdB